MVLGVFLSILLAFLDISLAVIEQHSLTDGARQVARAAAVHGSRAQYGTDWGPVTYVGTAADWTDIAETLDSSLIAVEPLQTSLLVEWPDDDNQPGDRVRVTVEYRHESIFPFTYGTGLDLRAVSVMHVAH